jgi:hypothetical protein
MRGMQEASPSSDVHQSESNRFMLHAGERLPWVANVNGFLGPARNILSGR